MSSDMLSNKIESYCSNNRLLLKVKRGKLCVWRIFYTRQEECYCDNDECDICEWNYYYLTFEDLLTLIKEGRFEYFNLTYDDSIYVNCASDIIAFIPTIPLRFTNRFGKMFHDIILQHNIDYYYMIELCGLDRHKRINQELWHHIALMYQYFCNMMDLVYGFVKVDIIENLVKRVDDYKYQVHVQGDDVLIYNESFEIALYNRYTKEEANWSLHLMNLESGKSFDHCRCAYDVSEDDISVSMECYNDWWIAKEKYVNYMCIQDRFKCISGLLCENLLFVALTECGRFELID